MSKSNDQHVVFVPERGVLHRISTSRNPVTTESLRDALTFTDKANAVDWLKTVDPKGITHPLRQAQFVVLEVQDAAQVLRDFLRTQAFKLKAAQGLRPQAVAQLSGRQKEVADGDVVS